MRLSPYKTQSPKEFQRFFTNTADALLPRDNSSKGQQRRQTLNKRSLKKLTMKMYNHDTSSKKPKLKVKGLIQSKDPSSLTSMLSTPTRQFTMSCLKNIEKYENALSQSVSRLLPTSPKPPHVTSQRTTTIKVHYGEVVLKHTFHHETLVGEMHLHFFREMLTIEKSKWSRVLPLVGFEGLEFDSFVDYWINRPEQTLGVATQYCGAVLQLRPIFAVRPPRPVCIADFQIQRCIGVGGFSKVYLAKCNFTGELCALKFISKEYIIRNGKQKLLFNEREVLGGMSHSSLVSLHFSFETKNFVVFVLEYCPNNELYQYLAEKSRFGQPQARILFKQVLQGVSYLHQHRIIYRDIKLQNILVDAYGHLKISDFGLAKPRCQQSDIAYTYCGSPEYMAPEMLLKQGHSYEVDYYALGVLLYELLVGRSPFVAETKQQIYHQALNREVNFPKGINFSKEVKALIRGLLDKNPAHRIGTLLGVRQIMTHPWMKKNQTQNYTNPFYGKPFREYLEAREPDNSYIEQQLGEADFEHHFPQIYFQNPRFQVERKAKYTMLEKEALRLISKKGEGKTKLTRNTTTANTSAN